MTNGESKYPRYFQILFIHPFEPNLLNSMSDMNRYWKKKDNYIEYWINRIQSQKDLIAMHTSGPILLCEVVNLITM